jgi:hypothetical protein
MVALRSHEIAKKRGHSAEPLTSIRLTIMLLINFEARYQANRDSFLFARQIPRR